MKVILFFFICFLLPGSIYSQKQYLTEIDSLSGELAGAEDSVRLLILDQLVEKYFSINENKKMYQCLREMEHISKKLNDRTGIFKTYFYYGLTSFNLEWKSEQAIEYFHRCLKEGSRGKIYDPLTYSKVYNNLGLIYKNQERYDSAIFYYRKAERINRAHQFDGRNVVLLLNLSRMFYFFGNADQVLSYARECLNTAIKTRDDESICLGYMTMAEALNQTGSLKLSIDYNEKALRLSERIYGTHHSNTARLMSQLSNSYTRLGEYDKALSYAKQGAFRLRQIYGDIHPKIAESCIYLGRSYIGVEKYDSAEYWLNKALQCRKMVKGKFSAAHLSLYLDLARSYLAKENFPASIKYLDVIRTSERANRGQKSTGFMLLGDIFLKKKDYTNSLTEYQKAILQRVNNPYYYPYKNPLSQDLINQPLSILSKDLINQPLSISLIEKKAHVYEALYQKYPDSISFLHAAMTDYMVCDTLISMYRDTHKNEEDNLMLNNSSTRVYTRGIGVAHQLNEIFNQSKYPELAFMLAEKSKSNLLYQSASHHHAMQYSMLPDSVLVYENKLKDEIAFCLTRLKEAPPNQSSRYEDMLFDAKRKYANYLLRLEESHPRYYQLRHGRHFLTLPEVQQRLGERTLIEYVVADSSIFIFLVRNDHSEIVKVRKPQELEEWIAGFRNSIISRNHTDHQSFGRRLYGLLFEPITPFLQKEDEIIIVPDGNLWYVNFDLLIQKKEHRKNYNQLAYLINDYTISYANSANHLLIKDAFSGAAATTKATSYNGCLAFSFSNSAASSPADSPVEFSVLRNLNSDLPGTRKEIRKIAEILPGKYYFGSLASESAFKKESRGYQILHLALHGELNDSNPLFSRLHFSPNARDTTDDGYLNTYEIYSMNLNSELAVLSACNTGYGKLEKGEGLMSLGRAFQYAGVNSLLLTKWEVADEETPEIMESFYRNLSQGMKKTEALRRAKLQYLRTAGMYKSAPYYWGGFIIVGDDSPVTTQSANSAWMYLAWFLATVAVAAVLITIRVRRASH